MMKLRESVTFILPVVMGYMLCCGDMPGGTTMHIAELGLSMELPSGWIADRQNPRMFFDAKNRDDNFGMVEDYPLEGQSLQEYVEHMSNVGGARTISTIPVTISGHEAIEVVTEAVYTVIEVDIQKGEDVIRVSFRALREDYPTYEEPFRGALRSIELR